MDGAAKNGNGELIDRQFEVAGDAAAVLRRDKERWVGELFGGQGIREGMLACVPEVGRQ